MVRCCTCLLGLSSKSAAGALSFLHIVQLRSSHVFLAKKMELNWIQKYRPQKVLAKRTKISEL